MVTTIFFIYQTIYSFLDCYTVFIPFRYPRSVEEVSSSRRHKIEQTLESEELVPIEERSRSGGDVSGSSVGAVTRNQEEYEVGEEEDEDEEEDEEYGEEQRHALPEVTSPEADENVNPEVDFEHVVIETSQEKVSDRRQPSS